MGKTTLSLPNKFWKRIAKFLLIILIIWATFGFIYCKMYQDGTDFTHEGGFEKCSDAWYFGWISMIAVGYGDIVPKSDLGRTLVCIQSGILWVSTSIFGILALEYDFTRPRFK